MKKYRKYNWPQLIEEFNGSGQSQIQFCKDQKINPNYFNQQLRKHLLKNKSKFVAVSVESPIGQSVSESFSLTVGRCQIQCPSSMSLPSFAALVQSLA